MLSRQPRTEDVQRSTHRSTPAPASATGNSNQQPRWFGTSYRNRQKQDSPIQPGTRSQPQATPSTQTQPSMSMDQYHPTDSTDRLLPQTNTDDAFVNVNNQLTPELIESEFKNLLAIHERKEYKSSEQIFPNAILKHRSHRNGSFAQTVIFREADDTYIGFPHQTVTISPVNLTKFWFYYEKYKTDYNIVLDSRLQLLIMYTTIAYADELIVYNAYTAKVVNLYDYCSELFKIAASELNIRQIQELFIMKMVISYYLYDQGIPWQVNQIINNLKELHTYSAIGVTKKTIIDIMANYLRCGSVNNFDRNNVERLFKLFHTYFSTKAYSLTHRNHDVVISKWAIRNLTLEDVYVTFMLLKEANFTFIKNDDM